MPETFHSWFRIRTTCYFGLVPWVEDRSACGRHQASGQKREKKTFGTQGKCMTRAFIELYVYITKVPSGKNLLIFLLAQIALSSLALPEQTFWFSKIEFLGDKPWHFAFLSKRCRVRRPTVIFSAFKNNHTRDATRGYFWVNKISRHRIFQPYRMNEW